MLKGFKLVSPLCFVQCSGTLFTIESGNMFQWPIKKKYVEFFFLKGQFARLKRGGVASVDDSDHDFIWTENV
jgi:hypothetical protein